VAYLHDDADLNRAVQMYRYFYRSVSGAAIIDGMGKVGVCLNKVFGFMDTQPRHVGFTLNSDTPYGAILLDLSVGPIVIKLPPGPLIGATLDIHQGWILDMGLPGPDAGRGGKHLLLPPGYRGDVPTGHQAAESVSYRVIGAVRAIPQNGDVAAALQRLQSVKVHPLEPQPDWTEPSWLNITTHASGHHTGCRCGSWSFSEFKEAVDDGGNLIVVLSVTAQPPVPARWCPPG
jgi:hypothetical protein